jgi:hypothetical protein
LIWEKTIDLVRIASLPLTPQSPRSNHTPIAFAQTEWDMLHARFARRGVGVGVVVVTVVVVACF